MHARRILIGAGALLAGLPLTAAAHGFGRLYNLPVPFWLYAWTASAALLLSFLISAWFATAPAAVHKNDTSHSDIGLRGLRRLRVPLQLISVGLLALCIVSGLIGNRDPQRNFNMTFFWVHFVLGASYLTALLGNFYAALSPQRALAEWIGRLWRGYTDGRIRYPHALGDTPALIVYLAFIGFELFGNSKPFSLSVAMLGYTLLSLVGVWLVGLRAWFTHCDAFSVFLRLIALIAPIDYRPADSPGTHGTLRWRLPFSGLVRERPQQLSTVLFVLAMLSTTAFDGLRATQNWVFWFWSDPSGIVTSLLGGAPYSQVARALDWYRAWESAWLLASPLIYFAFFWSLLWIGGRLAGSRRATRELALDFAYPLLPIALVYNITHYATLILTQGLKIVSLTSDPFGWNWNLFGTAWKLRAPILPDMGWVWHSQVGLILAGHLLGVWLAHRVALQVFETPRQALRSQLPMLLIMMAFTVTGLWILAQPLTAELMR
ncbi:MAG TPA: hypothetical protein VGE51_16790 [Fontimonas sp.]